jgi:hypothetical protein
MKGTTYYVSTVGDDTNNGALSMPFKTIQHATNQLSPGDTLYIRDGIYYEKVFCNASGTSSNPILISAFANEHVFIDGTGVIGNDLFVLNAKNYITLNGITFQNNYIQGAKGIYVLSSGEGINITNCTVQNIGWTTDPLSDPYSVTPTGQAHGIIVNGRTTEGIKNIMISDCNINNIITGNSEALTLVGNVDGFLIERDTVHNTKNIGIVIAGHYSWAVDTGVDAGLNQARNGAIKSCITYENRRFSNVDAPAGIYADGAKNVIISGNTSYSNGNGISAGCENAGFSGSNITIVNNLIYGNDNQGIYFGSNAGQLENSLLKNNTFVENGTLGNFYSEVSLQNSTNCQIVQNILIPSSSSHYAVSIFGYTVSNLIVDNNLAYRYNENAVNLYIEGTPSQFTPSNSLSENPLFVNPSILTPDFNLQSSSPAIDKGLLSYVTIDTLDQNNQARLVNGKLDHGALEVADGGCPSTFLIDTNYFITGKFTANQEIIFQDAVLSSTGKTTLYAPIVAIPNLFDLEHEMEIYATGCQQ